MKRGLGIGLCVLGLSCGESATALTQVVVLVGGDAEIRALEVRVRDATTGKTSSARTIDLERRASKRLPTSFTIVPAASHEAGKFRLAIEGVSRSDEGDVLPLARTEVVASFTRGETTLLPIVLSAACANERCRCDGIATCDSVCRVEVNASARCVPTPEYGPLPKLAPGQELTLLTTPIAGCGRGAFPGPNGACEDIDECAFGVDSCSPSPLACVNRPPESGRFACACPAGFTGQGVEDEPCVACDGGPCGDASTRADVP